MSLDLDKRSRVVNVCPWSICFKLPNSGAEILLEANKSKDINNAELVSLADNEDIMFYGTQHGDHARVFIDNKELREFVGFDDPDTKRVQFILNDEECRKIFELKTDSAFEKNVKEKAIMHHEKTILVNYARKNKINDYNRIKFLEQYTGMKF